MTEENRIVQLLVKYLRGELSEVEKQELEAWTKESPENVTFMETRFREDHIKRTMYSRLNINNESVRKKIIRLKKKRIINEWFTTSLTRIRFNVPRPVYYVFLLFATLVAVFIFKKMKTESLLLAISPSDSDSLTIRKLDEKSTSLPVSTIMFISDRETIDLTNARQTKLTKEDGWNFVKEDDTTFAYVDAGSSDQTSSTNPVFNILYNPSNASPITIHLPGQITVSLSRSSILCIPVKSPTDISEKRKYYLIGEALFDIQPNSNNPLTLITSKGEINVLGTQFKIRDYRKEDSFNIRLISGSVRVSNKNMTQTLSSSESLSFDTISNAFHVSLLADSLVTERKSPGKFNFSGRSLKNCIEEISKWYGLDKPEFQKGVNQNAPFMNWGFQKDQPLSDILNLSNKDTLTFSIKDEHIYVSSHNH